MSEAASLPREELRDGRRFSFVWIESARVDLCWYIGSSLLGLVYLPLIFLGHDLLTDGAGRPLYQVTVVGRQYPLTVALIVTSSWALFLDGPHFWPTLVRTLLDPREWKIRGGVLRVWRAS